MPTVKGGGEPLRLLREARGAASAISRRLSDSGFADMPPNGPLVLAAIVAEPEAAGGLLSAVDLPEQEISRLIDALASGGYLEHRTSPDEGRRIWADLTDRGRDVLPVLEAGLRAARWADFPHRRGDIVISAPIKCGSTWTQTICALLIFQTPDFPGRLIDLSPWLDELSVSRQHVFGLLAAQRHRRFIKTHLPLSELALEPEVSYIVVARHPLDAAMSAYRATAALHQQASDDSRSGQPIPLRWPRDWLLGWLDGPVLPQIMVFLSDAWARRSEPNVILLHYDDLLADLEGQMRRLAAWLGVAVRDSSWPTLVKAATFREMRAAADRIQPLRDLKDAAAFFSKGTSGSGRELLTSGELARYHAGTAQLASPDLLAWLHRQDLD
jgi:aryl sulfotransferase